MKHFLLLVIALHLPKLFFGQIYYPDHYKIELQDLWIEHSKKDISRNKVKSIKAFYTSKKGKRIPYYEIAFNKSGNPTYKKNIAKGFDVDSTKFQYNDLQQLVLAEQNFIKSIPKENLTIKNSFDTLGKLNYQEITRLRTYPKDYKYRGVKYPDDTNIIQLNIIYKGEIVTYVIRKLIGNYDEKVKIDTIYYNAPFDSVFMNKSYKAIYDSSGKITEAIVYKTIHANVTSEVSSIFKYKYSVDNQLIEKKIFNKDNIFTGKVYWFYLPNGLVEKRISGNSIHSFEYEYYE